MPWPVTISVTTVLLLSAISDLNAAPLGPFTCEGTQQPDGSFVFRWSDDLIELISPCEPQIIIEEKVCATYEGGKVPVSWIPPLTGATMHNFTLSSCPKSVKMGMDCPVLWTRKYLYCSCDTSTRSTPSGSTAKPQISGTEFGLIGVFAVCGILAIIALMWKYRERIKDLLMKRTKTSPASSSDEELAGALNPE